jgi:hypothetical protein
MILRKFNLNGEKAFREAILNHDFISQDPTGFLTHISDISTNPRFSDELKGEIELQPFQDRLLFAEFLYNAMQRVMKENPENQLIGDSSFWNWLAAAWLPSLVQADTRPDLLDKIGESQDAARWLLISDKTRFHRHLVSGPYFAYEANVDDIEKAKVLFAMFPDNKSGNVLKSGELWERLIGKTALSTGSIVHLATLMFVDPVTGKLYPNSGDKRQGAQAFSKYFSQIDLTLDYHGMDVETLISILPKHLQKWVPGARKSLSLGK